MTKFMTLEKHISQSKKTVFTKFVGIWGISGGVAKHPEDFDNVLFIGHDDSYGDVFKAWNNFSENFNIYFGEKGDEFDD